MFQHASLQVLPVYTFGNGTYVQIAQPEMCGLGHIVEPSGWFT